MKWKTGAWAFALAGFVASANPYQGYQALVYKGLGACADGCSEAAAEIPAALGLNVKYISAKTFFDSSLTENVKVWVQPGGNAVTATKTLGQRRLDILKNWIFNGGNYVGFCAGGFMADHFVDDDDEVPGLGILPGTSDYLDIDSNHPIGIILPLKWLGKARQVFFNGGAMFKISKKATNVDVLAVYEDQSAAAISFKYGAGRVVVSGFHPEAPMAWRAQSGLYDPDGIDTDLAVEMLRRALGQ